MTREDAINYLEGSLAFGEDDDSRHHNEVLEFIIKTLEQEPCEDTISRQAAIDAIMGEPTDLHYPSWYVERLEQLPAAHPDQLMKDWKLYNEEKNGNV